MNIRVCIRCLNLNNLEFFNISNLNNIYNTFSVQFELVLRRRKRLICVQEVTETVKLSLPHLSLYDLQMINTKSILK